MNPFKLHSKGPNDKVITTSNGPVFIRNGTYYSVNEIRLARGIEIKYEVRYKLGQNDFEHFGLTPPE
jgi:hypothetical protein